MGRVIIVTVWVLASCTPAENDDVVDVPPMDTGGDVLSADASPPAPPDLGQDLGPPADAMVDVQAPDAAPPAGPTVCTPCTDDSDCGDGSCLTNRNTMEQFCGAPCEDGGDCPRGADCLDINENLRQCVPSGATCSGFPPPDLGAECAADGDCVVQADVCLRAGEVRYCGRRCATDDDCTVGYEACVEGACRADWERGPQGCGRAPLGLAPCDAEGRCAEGLLCATDWLDLPELVAPFCTRECEDAGDCPDGARCAPTAAGRLCLDAPCGCLARPPTERLLDEALAFAGVDRCTAGFRREMINLIRADIAHDPFRLSFYNAAHQNAFAGLTWARRTKGDLAARAVSATPVADLIDAAAALLDQPTDATRAALTDDGDAALVTAIEAVFVAAGHGDEFDERAVTMAVAPASAALRAAAAAIIHGQLEVVRARAVATEAARLGPDLLPALHDLIPTTLITREGFLGISMTHPEIRRLLSGGLDLRAMYTAGRDLAAGIEGLSWEGVTGTEGFAVDVETPLGRVILADAGQSVHEGEVAPLLVIDTGGNDEYLLPVAATDAPGRPVSVLVELGGNDRYGYPGHLEQSAVHPLPPADAAGRYDGTHPDVGDAFGPISLSGVARQGAGILGVGLLFDLAGSDRYRSHKASQGAGMLGIGALFDAAGNDGYWCEQGCQGAGSYGIGLLVDHAGGDRYIGANSVQGFGYVRGFGYLHDEAGHDRHLALPGDPEIAGGTFLYPNAQNATSNTSKAQGAGFGRRADFTDQVFASGGIGVFRDSAGEDEYTVDVFGQATGFWYGTGLFSDGGGDDTYLGRWYTQGSGAHFALSFFFEEGGDDVYNERESIIATAVGQGHDISLGWLIDYAGDDRYVAPSLGLGGGNDNGIGLLLDLDGDDHYDVPDGTTYGGARIGDRGEAYDAAMCLGLFLDASGADTYTRPADHALIGEGRSWTWRERHPETKPGEHGAGMDADGTLTLEPASEAP